MTKGLPATVEDAEIAAVEDAAVARARRYVRKLKSGEISAQPLELRDSEGAAPPSWFGRENSRAWVKTCMKALAADPPACILCLRARPRRPLCRRRSPPRDHRRTQRAGRGAAHVAARLRYRDHEGGAPAAGRKGHNGGGPPQSGHCLRDRRHLPRVRSPSDTFAGLAAARPERLLYRGARFGGGTRSHLGVGRCEGVDAIQLPSRVGHLASSGPRMPSNQSLCTLYFWCRA